MKDKNYGILSLPVIVAALGYFVDIYDLLLFTIVREPSLRALGVQDGGMLAASTKIINGQDSLQGLVLPGNWAQASPWSVSSYLKKREV